MPPTPLENHNISPTNLKIKPQRMDKLKLTERIERKLPSKQSFGQNYKY